MHAMATIILALPLLSVALAPMGTVSADSSTADSGAKVKGLKPGNVGQLCADNGNGFCIKSDGKLFDFLTGSNFNGTHANGVIKAESDPICKGNDIVTSKCPFPAGSPFNAQFKKDKIVKLVFTSINKGHDCVGATGSPIAAADPQTSLRVCPGRKGDHTGTVWIIGGTKKNFLVNLYITSETLVSPGNEDAQDLCSGASGGASSATPIVVRPTTLIHCEYSLYYH